MEWPTGWVPDDIPEWEPPSDDLGLEDDDDQRGYDWGDIGDAEDDDEDPPWGWPA